MTTSPTNIGVQVALAATSILLTIFVTKLYTARIYARLLRRQGCPMPPHHWLFGHIALSADIVKQLPPFANGAYIGDLIRRRYPNLGDAFYLDTWPFASLFLVISSPDMVYQMTQAVQLLKARTLRTFLQPLTGREDLVTLEGDTWKRWRRIFNPGFSAAHVSSLIPGMVEEAEVFKNALMEHVNKGDLFYLEHLTLDLTIDIIGRVVMDLRFNSQTQHNAFTTALRRQIVWTSTGFHINPLEYFNVLRPFVQKYNTWVMNRYLTQELDRRYGAMQEITDGKNIKRSVIDLALQAYLEEHPSAKGIDTDFKEFAMAQIKLFIFAGHDTTSTGAVFTYHLLAKHPRVLAKVREEHTRVFGTSTAASVLVSTPSLLNKLTFTLAVIKESLRLYPTVAAWREGQPNFAIITEKGQSLPTENCMVWGDHYGTHYNSHYWSRPSEFLPERFLVTEDDPLHPPKSGWRPFERGPRNCIGQELALTEIKVMLALTVREIDFEERYEEFDEMKKLHELNERMANTVEGQMLLDIHKASPPHISPENLLSVDFKRIVDFVSASHLLSASLCKLIISVVFLYKLLRWQSVLAGIGVLVIMTPLNLYLSKLMTTAQSALMYLRDQKIVVVNEALQGTRQIKFAASEHQWLNRIKHIRERELKKQFYCSILRTALVRIWTLGPVMISAVALTAHALLTGQLLPSVAFTSVAILSQVEGSLAIIPKLVMQMMEAAVSAARITHYLDGEELDQYLVHGDGLYVVEASISWPAILEDRPVRSILSTINIHFPSGKLSVISGPSGSGKSLLLAALIGEADKKCGIIAVPRDCGHNVSGGWILPGTIAFVSQVPWIEKDTIRGNIVFGLPLDLSRYAKVLSACALSHDLAILPDGDMTEVGLGGINLSGGQKWRISFAWALYSRAGILILDDIFSALDTHVGRHILERALCGQLGESRTRILATHHTDLCVPWASCHVTLANGTISNVLYETVDSPRDLTQSESNNMHLADAGAPQSNRPESLLPRDRRNHCSNLSEDESDRGRRSTRDDHRGQDVSRQAKSLVGAEKKEIGSVKFKTYKGYVIVSGGLWAVAVVLLTQVGYIAFILARSWWISIWTRAYTDANGETPISILSEAAHPANFRHITTPYQLSDACSQGHNLHYYIGVSIALSFGICILFVDKFFSVLAYSIKGSRVLFNDFSTAILNAPLQWLDTTPFGRILNRYTADFNTIDESLADGLGFFLNQALQLTAIIAAGVAVSPLVLGFAIVLLFFCILIARLYLPGAHDVKRIESITRSPIFEHFDSVTTGMATIRAYGMVDVYAQRLFGKTDDHARATWHRYLFNLWMILRLNLAGTAFATLVAGITVLNSDVDASLAGFDLSFALQYTVAMEWTVRQYSSTQMSMNSAERIFEYSQMPVEDASGEEPPACWASNGAVEFDDVWAGYTPEQHVLKGLSFRANPNERIGIVGRTGAGKSSLALTLFRFLEIGAKRILIDDVDILGLKLSMLRSRLAIIPQDPVIFAGTIRSNMDPFDEYTDVEIQSVLSKLPLSSFASTHGKFDYGTMTPLSDPILQNVHNLSADQRQLLCLGRALLGRRKIIVMDEAISSVDKTSDTAIQQAIRKELGESTLLVIAHRLSTVADFDRILVMDEENCVEFGEPKNLMRSKGAYWRLVQQSGEIEEVERMIMGQKKG